jgi:hypothetical protein
MDIFLHHFLAWFLHSPRSVFGGALVAPGGLLVEGIRLALAHAALRLLLCVLLCFALHALRSALRVCFAFPRCATGGNGFDNACDGVKHDNFETGFNLRGHMPPP